MHTYVSSKMHASTSTRKDRLKVAAVRAGLRVSSIKNGWNVCSSSRYQTHLAAIHYGKDAQVKLTCNHRRMRTVNLAVDQFWCQKSLSCSAKETLSALAHRLVCPDVYIESIRN